MTDYILRFDSKQHAEAFGLQNDFASINPEDNSVQPTLASETYAINIIGEHNGDGKYWVLFRDNIDRPLPDGANDIVIWTSASDTFRPTEDPAIPNCFWC